MPENDTKSFLNAGTAQTAGVAVAGGVAASIVTIAAFTVAFRMPKHLKKYLPKKTN
jgi:hypothetical protein